MIVPQAPVSYTRQEEQVFRELVRRTFEQLQQQLQNAVVFPSWTAANIASKTHAVNTVDKVLNKIVYDSTNHRLMIARGVTDVSVWDVCDGSASVTPS